MLKPDRSVGRLSFGKAKRLLWKGVTQMSMMPTDRNSDWQKFFDRYGSLDGGRRQKPLTGNGKPASEADSNCGEGRPSGSLPQPAPQDRRARKR